MTRITCIATILVVCVGPSLALQGKPGGIRIQTATRQVVLFSRLESDLNDAISQHDKDKLITMLGDDFEVRKPNLSGDPIPREEWIASATSGELPPPSRRGRMAVRSFGDVAIVDFVEETSPHPSSKVRFVVDVWKGSGESWKLALRYVSESESKQGMQAAKPTGKE